MQGRNGNGTSPESMVVPTIDMDHVQMEISGERFPQLVLELCDNCYWCLTCINGRGVVHKCPVCECDASLIPMNIDEVCSIEYDEKRGVSLHFDRRHPLR